MDQEVFLEVGQLGEGLGAHLAAEGALTRVRPQMHLQVAQLAKHLVARLTLVLNLPVLLLEGIGQRLVAGATHLLLSQQQNN